MMNTATRINNTLKNLPAGKLVGYADIGIASDEYQAAAKVFGRLVASGMLKRASTGLFYKPKQTVFGELQPAEEELLRPYLFDKGRRIGYITGLSLYNKMGLTNQVPSIINIASREKRIVAKVGNIRVRAVKSYAEVTDKNYHLLELLDALKDFKAIQDMDETRGIKIVISRIEKISFNDKKNLVSLAILYPPRVRALLGSLLENMNVKPSLLNRLKENLNPLSSFKLGIGVAVLPNSTNWNIR